VLGILILLVGVDLALSSGASLWDRDEPRFARAAVEMVKSSDYLVPRFNGELRPDKPILIYWLMSVPLRIMGPSTLAVRLPSVIGMAGSALFTFFIAARLFDRRIALRAMFFFATALMPAYMGSAATADAVLLAFILLALWMFIEAIAPQRKQRWWCFAVMAIALGGAQLTKGPVGLAVPVLSMIGATWLTRARAGGPGESASPIPMLHEGAFWRGVGIAVVVSFALFLAWAVPANIATAGQFAEKGLGKHVFQRIFAPQEGHGGSGLLGYLAMLPLYLPVLVFATFPWVVHVPAAISGMLRRRVGDARQRAILWGWITPTFLLMSLVATKLPHYIMPIVPALCIAAAAAVDAQRRGGLGEKDRRWLRDGGWFFAPIAVAGLAALLVGPWVIHLNGERIPGFITAGLIAAVPLFVMLVVVLIVQGMEKLRVVNVTLGIGAPLALLLIAGLVLPGGGEALKISPELAQAVHGYAAERGLDHVPVWTCGYQEPSLMFYLNQPAGSPVLQLPETGTDIRQWVQEAGPGALVVTRENLDQAALPPGSAKELIALPLINYSSRGQAGQVVVVGR
jgi:4-amino-4-deoxy-L-arabinose transferase-like glycosyltransferase